MGSINNLISFTIYVPRRNCCVPVPINIAYGPESGLGSHIRFDKNFGHALRDREAMTVLKIRSSLLAI